MTIGQVYLKPYNGIKIISTEFANNNNNNTCCHSDSSERPPTDSGVKNSQNNLKSQERLITVAINIIDLRINWTTTNKRNLENKNGKKNKCMDTSSDKLKKLF